MPVLAWYCSGPFERGTRWFSPADLPRLRAHFAPLSRKGRYQPQRPEGARAPLIVLTQPQGRVGRSVAARHMAPAGQLGRALHLPSDAITPGVAGLIARSAAHHLRRFNATRLDRGEAPLPMDETLTAALRLRAQALILPCFRPIRRLLAGGCSCATSSHGRRWPRPSTVTGCGRTMI